MHLSKQTMERSIYVNSTRLRTVALGHSVNIGSRQFKVLFSKEIMMSNVIDIRKTNWSVLEPESQQTVSTILSRGSRAD